MIHLLVCEELDPEKRPCRDSGDYTQWLDWDTLSLLKSIRGANDWLHRLGNTVRKANFVTQNQRSADYVLKDEWGNDVTTQLSEFYTYLVKRECEDIAGDLSERLVRTMLLRRKRILYRQSRLRVPTPQRVKRKKDHRSRFISKAVGPQEGRLQSSSLKAGEGSKGEVAVPRSGSPSALQNQLTRDNSPTGSVSSETLPSSSSSEQGAFVDGAPSMLAATVLDREKFMRMVTPSRISRATSAPFQPSEKLLVPPRPRAADLGDEFVCDYCCLILPSALALDPDKWA